MPLPPPTAPLAAWPADTALPQWHVLSSDWRGGQDFLPLWAHWRAAAVRPARLFFTAVIPATEAAAVPALAARSDPDAQPAAWRVLINALTPQLYGLLPGVHRIALDGGNVQLTLWVGDIPGWLRQPGAAADHVLLHAPQLAVFDLHTAKAWSRQCRRGSVLSVFTTDADVTEALRSSGFVPTAPMAPACGTPSDAVHTRFDPAWTPRVRTDAGPTPVTHPGHALVLGAGLAGAAVAHSLAQRGWHVTVLGQGAAPADGASGLPAGLFCPHVSPDDSVLSRLSRSGVRLTLQRLQALAQPGHVWGHSGVLEHGTDGDSGLPAAWAGGPGDAWSLPASAAQRSLAGLPADTTARWHPQAGWVRPALWVHAQLQHPRIRFVGAAHVARLQQVAAARTPGHSPHTAAIATATHLPGTGQADAASNAAHPWQALGLDGQVLAQADIAIIAAGPASAQLLPAGLHWPLQAIRGQVTCGAHTAANAHALPPFPVNGHGNLVSHIPGHGAAGASGAEEVPAGSVWIMGSTFERDVTALPPNAADQALAHAGNFAKLGSLLPASATALAPWFDPAAPQCQPTWAQVRCASHDRLPIVGPVDPLHAPGLWAVTALGARGLTLSVLCAELLAARLHGEPLPLDAKLAQHLGSERLPRHAAR